jgi:hypothetical protein
MEGAPRVAAPVRPLGMLDGITMLLVTVEAWPDSVVVRVAGLPNERMAALEAEYQHAIETWAAARGERGPSRPPREPGAAALGRLGLTIRDDLGTPYRVATGSAGGTANGAAVGLRWPAATVTKASSVLCWPGPHARQRACRS